MKKAVCLDFDSTIIKHESLDAFSKYLEKFDKIEELTNNAMNGNMSFRESIRKRIEILSPFTKEDINHFIMCNVFNSDLVDDCNEFIKLCKKLNYDVYIISGGFSDFIKAYITKGFLDIELENVYCNEFEFEKDKIVGLKNKDLSFNNGKVNVIKELRNKYDKIFMIGDGATDLETQNFVDLFIGFGGVVERQNVRINSHIYCWSYKWLMGFFDLLL